MLRATFVLVLTLVASAATPRKWIVPDFRDLTIKTRITEGLTPPRETTWFLKGPRSRFENRVPSLHLLGKGPRPGHRPLGRASQVDASGFTSAFISQCDLRTVYHLQPFWKTYVKMTVPERNHPLVMSSPLQQMLERNPRGPDVTITVDTVDTGERRQMGSYEARHVKTTVTVEPSNGAATKPGKAEVDGWYLDLRGLSCMEQDTPAMPQVSRIMFEVVRNNDHPVLKLLGTAPTGFAVEEKSRRREGGNAIVSQVELLEFSEASVDPSLFEPPPDYTPRKPGQMSAGLQADSDGWINLRH